jgi:hypothetical protein
MINEKTEWTKSMKIENLINDLIFNIRNYCKIQEKKC